MLTSYRTQDYRFQTSTDRTELFVPPNEETDVSGDNPAVTESFETHIQEWLETKGEKIEANKESKLTDEMRSQLRDLGYVE